MAGPNKNDLTKRITIAVDGHSSCGKSTLAKDLASALHYQYIDSGAMYRAVTLYFLRHQVDLDQAGSVDKALEQISISFANNNTFLNGEDVEEEIRQMKVSQHVSQVAAVSSVRRAMVLQQQQMNKEGGIVMDGRDIGTVVFPKAELKIFLTADIEERVRRRYQEILAKGKEIDKEAVRQNLEERDRIDSTRADSPLRKADDAIVINNTHLNREQQLSEALNLVRKITGEPQILCTVAKPTGENG